MDREKEAVAAALEGLQLATEHLVPHADYEDICVEIEALIDRLAARAGVPAP